MKYRFCNIRIIVTKYDVTFATKGGGSTSRCYATGFTYDGTKEHAQK